MVIYSKFLIPMLKRLEKDYQSAAKISPTPAQLQLKKVFMNILARSQEIL